MLLRSSTPGKLGIPPKAISDFLQEIKEKGVGLHSFMLLRHGEIAAKGWWKPYNAESLHQLYSLSKSFTSTAVGFCVQEGLLSIEDDVLSFFPDELPCKPCENMRKMKVKHLLTMGTGHISEPNALSGERWAYNFLSSFIPAEPGSVFCYNTPATYMLSRIVQKVCGEKVFDYLTPRLFEPLGITGIYWEESPEGANTGGYGLNLHTEDIAKFGQFLLNRGSVDGKQLLNAEWIDLATAKQISNGDPNEDNDWSQGYGFQFWRCKPEGVYRGDGAFGQLCVVMPRQDAVFSATAGQNDIGLILKLLWKHILPQMGESCADDGLDELNETLGSLEIPMPEGVMPEPSETAVYAVGENPLGLREISVTLEGEKANVTLDFAPHSFIKGGNIPFGYRHYLEAGEKTNRTMGAFAENEDGEILFRFVMVETPYIREIKYKPHGDFAEFSLKQNVGFMPINFYLIGKRK